MDHDDVATFAAICAVSYLAGEGLARLRIPRLPVYMAVGAVVGLINSNADDAADLALPVLNPAMLFLIGLIAGSHLLWGEIRPQLKPISLQVAGLSVCVPLAVGGFVFVTIAQSVPTATRLAVALLAGTIMLALSPPVAIAVVSESRAAGPFTKLVLGATVAMDVIVVSLFSVAITVAKVLVGRSESTSTARLILTIGLGIAVAAVVGVILGLALKLLVRVIPKTPATVLICLLAGLGVWLVNATEGVARTRFGLELEIEVLLVATVAGLVVANFSADPEIFEGILDALAPWAYVLFFTLVGLGLHLDTLLAAAGSAAAVWALRLVGLWGGSTAAMTVAGQSSAARKTAWRAFVPQAGIALALAATVTEEFPKIGPLLAAVIIGTIVLNEITGPFFLRSALRANGEARTHQDVLD